MYLWWLLLFHHFETTKAEARQLVEPEETSQSTISAMAAMIIRFTSAWLVTLTASREHFFALFRFCNSIKQQQWNSFFHHSLSSDMNNLLCWRQDHCNFKAIRARTSYSTIEAIKGNSPLWTVHWTLRRLIIISVCCM